MSSPTQDYRLVQISSVFGKDVLLFHTMVAQEELSRLFNFQLEAYSKDDNLDFKKIIGTAMSVFLGLPENRERYFNGWVSEFAQIPSSVHRYSKYRIVLRPWLWFLSRYADCRFFQEKNIPDILEDIFDHRGMKDYDLAKLQRGSYPKREYCAQYRETDFNFVSRRMEEEGIYYYFEHTEDGKHILKIVDDPADHKPAPGYASLPYTKSFHTDAHAAPKEAVYDWFVNHAAQPSGYALNSFDFENPAKPLYKLVEPKSLHPEVRAVIYDYPDMYRELNEGERTAKIRLEELHAQQEIIQAKSNAMGIAVGNTLSLSEHPRTDQNREYLITASRITLQIDDYESSQQDKGLKFHCEFTAQNAKTPYRPPRRTPIPTVQGPQTAIVVPEEGQKSEEISTDKHGRVKVRFHWNHPADDMDGKNQQERSCWIRVSHPWAGKKWGSIAIPRIGQEVIVDFEEGHTDRPLITGRVYNGDQQPPYGLPASKNISGTKSDSTKGSGGYNEIIMDDTKSKELIRIHAEYDMDTTVEHDQRNTILNDQTNTIKNHRTTTINKGNDTLTVETGKRAVTVKGDSTHTVQAGNRIVQVTGGDYFATSTDKWVKLKGVAGVGIHGQGKGVGVLGEPEVSIEGKSKVNIQAKDSVAIKAALVDVSNQEINIHGSQITLKCGGSIIQMDGTKIALSSGSGQLVLDATGATLKGALVKIN